MNLAKQLGQACGKKALGNGLDQGEAGGETVLGNGKGFTHLPRPYQMTDGRWDYFVSM